MNTNNLAKIIFIGLEITALIGVIALVLTYNGDAIISVIISLLAVYAVLMQREQQEIQWTDSNEEDDAIQMYIDSQQDLGR